MTSDVFQPTVSAKNLRTDSGHAVWSMIVVSLTVLTVALLTFFYRHTAVDLELRWRIDPSSSHGYLIPLAAAWLFRRRWLLTPGIDHQGVPKSEFACGIAAIVTGVVLHLVAALTTAVSLDGAGLVLLAFGLLWCWGGRRAARSFGPAILFLIFMVPLPFAWQQPVGEFLQHFVSATSEASLGLCGLVVHREGYILHLPGHVLEVAQGCSGIRQITVFLGISVFFGLIGGSRFHAATMLAFSTRITMTGLITWHLGPAWATGVLHDLEGLITVLFGLAMLWWLSKLITSLLSGDEASPKLPTSRTDEASGTNENSKPATTGAVAAVQPDSDQQQCDDQQRALKTGLPLATRLSIIVGIMLLAAGADSLMERSIAEVGAAPATPLVQPLRSFPETIGDWIGTDTPVKRDYFLYGDDHLHRTYVNRKTRQAVAVWMVYTTDGRDRGHNPEVCMRSAGCQESLDKRTTVDLPGEGAPAERFYFRQQSGRAGEWVTYWYHVFEPSINDRIQPSATAKLVERFMRVRSGVTVELFFAEQTEADVAAADEFAKGIESSLAELLPPDTRRDSRRKSFLMVTDTVIRDAE
jgi:exosortase